MHADFGLERPALHARCHFSTFGLDLCPLADTGTVEIIHDGEEKVGRVIADAIRCLWIAMCAVENDIHWYPTLRRTLLRRQSQAKLLSCHGFGHQYGNTGDGYWNYDSFRSVSNAFVQAVRRLGPATSKRKIFEA